MKLVGTLLAAGASRRLGRPKQLLELDDGVALVRRSALAALASKLDRLSVALDPSAAHVRAALGGLALEPIFSEDPREGIAASIRAGVAWALRQRADALLLCVCDQPLLGRPHLDRLLDAFVESRGRVASFYAERPGVPAVFPASSFAELARLEGDRGAGRLLLESSSLTLVPWPEGACDLDRPEDVRAWRRRARRAPNTG